MQSNVQYKQTLTASWSKSVSAWLCELRQDYKIYQTFRNLLYISVLKYFSLHKAPQKCLLSGLERCSSYREYSYSKMTEKRQGPKPCVRLTEVSVKIELTVNVRATFSNSQNRTKSNRVLHTRVFPRCIFPCNYDWFIQSTSHRVLWLVIENITRLKTAL